MIYMLFPAFILVIEIFITLCIVYILIIIFNVRLRGFLGGGEDIELD